MAAPISQQDRSKSRGRDVSFGRGGLGNIHSVPEASVVAEPKEHSVPRGRGIIRALPVAEGEEADESRDSHDTVLHSIGRGGLANMTSLRSPSVESPRPHDRVGLDEVEVTSSGRGGAGNIRSRSRSQARVESHPQPPAAGVISTGRGGAGNIRARSQSKARTDEVNGHSAGPHINTDRTDEVTSDLTASDPPHRTSVGELLHKIIHPGERKV